MPLKKITSPQQLQNKLTLLRAKGKTIGFVPTMGALHEGHLSLIRKARKNNDVVVASIFVNPLQFGPKEDYGRYPRNLKEDSAKLKEEKVDYLFCPSVKSMYGEGGAYEVAFPPKSKLEPWQKNYCAKFRPGHFEGVATVVLKLLNIANPTRAYFGAKDYQQSVVIAHLVSDFNLSTKIVRCPIVREKDGLALSSRNVYLKNDEREKALAISRTLFDARKKIKDARQSPQAIQKQARTALSKKVDKLEYFAIVDSKTMEPLRKRQKGMVILAACWVGKTRLIDNVTI